MNPTGMDLIQLTTTAGEGAGERVGETLHPAIRLLVEVVRARCSVSILGTIELPFLYFKPSLYPSRDRLERAEPNLRRSSHGDS